MAEILSAQTLRQMTTCTRRVWLDRYGDAAVQVPVDNFFAQQGIRHEQLVREEVIGETVQIAAASWEEMVQITHTHLQAGTAGLFGAALERRLDLDVAVIVHGRIDGLLRVSEPSDLGGWSYRPIEIKQRTRLNPADLLQLDLYLWLLEAVQGVTPEGEFWLGRDDSGMPLYRLPHSYDHDRLQAAFQEVAVVYQTVEAPAIYLGKHCDLCPWSMSCREKARAENSVTLLSGLRRDTWLGLRQMGVETIDEAAALDVETLAKLPGVGAKSAVRLLAGARSMAEGQPQWRAPLAAIARQPGIMLDLETAADSTPWCFGWLTPDGETQVAVVDAYCDTGDFALPDGTTATIVEDSDSGWMLLAEAAQRWPGPIYHWSNFEQQILRKTAPPDVVELLEDRLHDLLATCKQAVMLPTGGYSIKKVGPYLGYHWPAHSSAMQAWGDYQRWLLDSDRDALARACAYQRADVESLQVVWQWLVDHTP
ncbi:MAG: TM0106 family RecB-like putative nuclease [Anaerolineae bacterium]|nr:TM0106 family RecB-like putative nuclease [Anaerolineae bacterium]